MHGVGCDEDQSLKGALRFVVEQIFEQLVAAAVWRQMIDSRRVVDHLRAVGYGHDGEFGVAVLAVDVDMEFVACPADGQRCAVDGQAAARVLRYVKL